MKKIVSSIAAAAIVLSQTAAVAEAGYFGEVYEEDTGEFYLVESEDHSIIYRPVDRRGGKWQDFYRDAKGDLYYADTFDYYISRLAPYPNDGTHPEIEFGSYDGYDLTVDWGFKDEYNFTYYCIGWNVIEKGSKQNAYFILDSIDDYNRYDFSEAVVRIPNRITVKSPKRMCEVKGIRGSSDLKRFDLDPENEYMKCVDNVIFSRDGKKLMSFAQHDERREYAIPEGTCSVGAYAFYCCYNLRKICFADTVSELADKAFVSAAVDEYEFSDSVEIIPRSCFEYNHYLKRFYISPGSKLRKIEEYAFGSCEELTELCLPSFEIEIDRSAFGKSYDRILNPITLKSYVQPTVQKEGNSLKWDKIPNASYYEVYQRLGNGEYKLLSTTKGTSCKLPALGKGKKYTFAVKPVAVIPGANYDKERDEAYPESFTVEGTMSEDITVEG